MKQGDPIPSHFSPMIDTSPLIPHPYPPFFHETIATLFLAGGHGSRLGTPMPKAMVPIPPSGKTLLEIFLRRMAGFFSLYSRWPHCLIMTSEENDEVIQQYLSDHRCFGVPSTQIHLFRQSSLPLTDEKGYPLQEGGVIQKGPDGNGRVFALLKEQGLLHILKKEGVQALSILPIDNPLMDPFLPSLFHPVLEEKKEAALLAIPRTSPQEQTGLFYVQNGKLHVIEYSEAPSSMKEALAPDGSLLYRWANISVLCASPSTLETLARYPLPLHTARKIRQNTTIYKQEYFLFDAFPALNSFSLIGLDRAAWFSPIKAKEGADSLVQAAHAFEYLQAEQAHHLATPIPKDLRASAIDPALLYGLPRKG